MLMTKPRRLFRISLRALLVLVTLACLWLGKISIAVRRQREAIGWIERNYGSVGYDWQHDLVGLDAERPNHSWVHRILGEDYFQTVVSVSLQPRRQKLTRDFKIISVPSRPKISDISELTALPDLERLNLRGNAIKDISPLGRLRKLRDVNVADNQIEDCTTLFAIKSLQNVEVQGNPLSAEMIAELREAFPRTALTWSEPKPRGKK
jgi:hypothetical protein